MARGPAAWVPPELKPYLTYSLGAHVALAVVAARLISSASVASAPVYTIDFVGPSTTIISSVGPSSSQAAAQSAAAAKPPPDVQPDEFSTKKRHEHAALPRPSLLRGYRQDEAPQEEEKPVAQAKTGSNPSAGADASGTPGDASVSADMPNFPYPWYIAQVRAALWAQWSRRMPKERGECVVVFTLLPDGRVTDLRTEDSSGDGSFDLTALGSVQDAGPYPALPKGFSEPFLKIHVTLKSS